MIDRAKQQSLALFDFDGTLTRQDSFFYFLIFSVGWPRFILGMVILSPVILGYFLKIIPNDRAKQKVFEHFFRNWTQQKFLEKATLFAQKQIPALLRENAMERLRWHKQEGHRICVVTASFENYMHIWAKEHGIDVIATKLEIDNGNLTGRLGSDNCYGKEKVRRIKEVYDLKDYSYIYAYGDSRGDKEMLELAHEGYLNWKKV